MNPKQQNRFNNFIIIVLSISIIMNFTLLTKVNHIENEVLNISHEQQYLSENVNNQSNQIHHSLNEFFAKQSWMGPITMNTDSKELDVEKPVATFEWQVKELQPDSNVIFHYAYGESDNFIELPAEELQQGLFQVKVPVEAKLEPQWEAVTIISGSHIEEKSKQAEEEAYHEQSLKYFISVSYGDTVRSSEISSEYLGYLGTNLYGVLQTDIHLNKNNIGITLMNHGVYESHNQLSEVYLLSYEGNKLVSEEEIPFNEEMSPPDGHMRLYELNDIRKYEDMKLVIRAIYSDGEIFEQEVY
ncbi:hypothetical protein [Bacillus pinisoli]|uniref:hypothetical protein n=1 Tax=Bacillus pinisoli TaxID=2901866 RepID=UPI001FF110E3|nr:hypothetical protein [Bacillus pinisoli]